MYNNLVTEEPSTIVIMSREFFSERLSLFSIAEAESWQPQI